MVQRLESSRDGSRIERAAFYEGERFVVESVGEVRRLTYDWIAIVLGAKVAAEKAPNLVQSERDCLDMNC